MPGQAIWRWTWRGASRRVADLGRHLGRHLGQHLARLGRPLRPGWRAAAGVAGVAVLLGGYLLDARVAGIEAQHRALGERTRQWEGPARDAARLRQQIAAVGRRGGALDALLQERGRPARLLDALARQVPRGVRLRSLSQQGDTVTIDGVARHHERVAALVRELEPAPWLARVELIESRAQSPSPGAAQGAADEAEALVAFSVRLVYRALATAGASAPPPRSQQRSAHGAG